ncbi:MAG: FAD-dependent oxidoreductase [Myxococcales bacterium]|jgi:isorenieratene synthase
MARLTPETLILPNAEGRYEAPPGKRAVVVGGGIAGVAAATVLGERGVKVTLIERESYLGGRAGGFPETLATGETLDMERGFHAFFRQYYNLQALLRRIDPALSMLMPLQDYPILGPEGMVQSFKGLPRRTPFQIMSLVAKTPYLRPADLMKVNGRAAMHMLTFDPEQTYARFDGISAEDYLQSLDFPPEARRMLFDVFAHSFFNPEEKMSAGELLMMFHFYFTGNPEGLIFDVARKPLSKAIWEPFQRWLASQGVDVRLATPVTRIERRDGGGYVVHSEDDAVEADVMVLALDVSGLSRLVEASPDLSPLKPATDGLGLTNPFAVWRLWLDRPVDPDRTAFVGTTGVGMLDNISVYERFQDESARWAADHGGSVVELHAYAVPEQATGAEIREDLLAGLHTFYPETRGARVLDERFLLRQDCPDFPVGGHAGRPGVQGPFPDLALAGDGIRVPLPCALMERATASGFLAASAVLAPFGVRSEPVRSVPRSGLFTPPRLPALPTIPGKSGKPRNRNASTAASAPQ